MRKSLHPHFTQKQLDAIEKLCVESQPIVVDPRRAIADNPTDNKGRLRKHRARPTDTDFRNDGWTFTRLFCCMYCGKPVQRAFLWRWTHVR